MLLLVLLRLKPFVAHDTLECRFNVMAEFMTRETRVVPELLWTEYTAIRLISLMLQFMLQEHLLFAEALTALFTRECLPSTLMHSRYVVVENLI